MEQRSPEWMLARAGHCTASRFSDVLAKIKTGEAASRRNYRLQLVTERLTGLPVDGYQNSAMQWGVEQEPFARAAYEARSGLIVMPVGFITHPKLRWVGASPDGLVGEDGCLEAKCPAVSTHHVVTLLDGVMPSEHIPQVQGQMWVTGRRWVDFVSFDPRMPEKHQIVVVRVERDDEYIAQIEREVILFLREVDQWMLRLR